MFKIASPDSWLKRDQPAERLWGLSFLSTVDLPSDAPPFKTQQQLVMEGWNLKGNVFRRDDRAYLPIYEAGVVHHFDHRCGRGKVRITLAAEMVSEFSPRHEHGKRTDFCRLSDSSCWRWPQSAPS